MKSNLRTSNKILIKMHELFEQFDKKKNPTHFYKFLQQCVWLIVEWGLRPKDNQAKTIACQLLGLKTELDFHI
jgi:hypothetical protein